MYIYICGLKSIDLFCVYIVPVACLLPLHSIQVCMLKTGIPVDVNNNVNDGGEKIDFTILL